MIHRSLQLSPTDIPDRHKTKRDSTLPGIKLQLATPEPACHWLRTTPAIAWLGERSVVSQSSAHTATNTGVGGGIGAGISLVPCHETLQKGQELEPLPARMTRSAVERPA